MQMWVLSEEGEDLPDLEAAKAACLQMRPQILEHDDDAPRSANLRSLTRTVLWWAW